MLILVRSHVLPEDDDFNETDEYRLVYNERRDQFVRRKQRMEDVEEDYKQAKAAYRAAVNVELDQHVHHGHGNEHIHGHDDGHEYVHQHDDYIHSHPVPYLPDFEECSLWNRWRRPCVDSDSDMPIIVICIAITIFTCCVCLTCIFVLRYFWFRRRRRREFKTPQTTLDKNRDTTENFQNIF